jgi:hypothetical protein
LVSKFLWNKSQKIFGKKTLIYCMEAARRRVIGLLFNHLTPNDLHRRRTVSHLKIKIPRKKSRQAALRGGISFWVNHLHF